MNVRLHIERLVVDGIGLGPGGGRRLQAAVEAELTRLVIEGGLGPEVASAAIPSLNVGAIPLDRNPSRLGAGLARTLYEGLKGQGGQ